MFEDFTVTSQRQRCFNVVNREQVQQIENLIVVLAGGFTGVHVYMTKQNPTQSRPWCDTKIEGVLKLIKVNEVSGLPIVVIRVYTSDESELMLEYELPLNFDFNPNLSETFSTVQIMMREGGKEKKHRKEHLGFLFTNEQDKRVWDENLQTLSEQLTLTIEQITQLVKETNEQMANEFEERMNKKLALAGFEAFFEEAKRANERRAIPVQSPIAAEETNELESAEENKAIDSPALAPEQKIAETSQTFDIPAPVPEQESVEVNQKLDVPAPVPEQESVEVNQKLDVPAPEQESTKTSRTLEIPTPPAFENNVVPPQLPQGKNRGIAASMRQQILEKREEMPIVDKPQKPKKSLAEQLQEQSERLVKPPVNPPKPKKSLAEQLQEQIERLVKPPVNPPKLKKSLAEQLQEQSERLVKPSKEQLKEQSERFVKPPMTTETPLLSRDKSKTSIMSEFMRKQLDWKIIHRPSKVSVDEEDEQSPD